MIHDIWEIFPKHVLKYLSFLEDPNKNQGTDLDPSGVSLQFPSWKSPKVDGALQTWRHRWMKSSIWLLHTHT